jgi:hypothetical protein
MGGVLARRSVIAKLVLVGTGLLFLVGGIAISGLRLAGAISESHGRLAPIFLALGTVGAFTAWFGLRDGRRWPLAILSVAYIPWTIMALISDSRQEYWLIVAGQVLGLLLVVWAVETIMRRAV